MIVRALTNNWKRAAESRKAARQGGSPTASAASFTNDVVGPFHQGNVDRNRAPLRVPTAQVHLRDPTGPGAGSSRKYRDAFGYNLRHGLAQGRPSDGFDRINGRFAHEVGSVVSEKYLHVMPGVGQVQARGKRRRMLESAHRFPKNSASRCAVSSWVPEVAESAPHCWKR